MEDPSKTIEIIINIIMNYKTLRIVTNYPVQEDIQLLDVVCVFLSLKLENQLKKGSKGVLQQVYI